MAAGLKHQPVRWDLRALSETEVSGTDQFWVQPNATGDGLRYSYDTGAWANLAGSGGGGTPGTPTSSIQYNNAGAFGGAANLTWDNTESKLDLTGRLEIEHSTDEHTDRTIFSLRTLTGSNTLGTLAYGNFFGMIDESTAGPALGERANILIRYQRNDLTTDNYFAYNIVSEMILGGATGSFASEFYSNYARAQINDPDVTLQAWAGYYAAYPLGLGLVTYPRGFVAEGGLFNGFGVTNPAANLHVLGSVRFDIDSDAVGDMYYRAATTFNLARVATAGKAVGNVLALYDSGGGVLLPNWAASGGTPGGSTTQIQYNNAGAFGGSANLTWDNANALATVTGRFAVAHSTTSITNLGLSVASTLTGSSVDGALLYQANQITLDDQNTVGSIAGRSALLVRHTRSTVNTDEFQLAYGIVADMRYTAATGTLDSTFIAFKSQVTVTAGGTLGKYIGFYAQKPGVVDDVTTGNGFVAESGLYNGFGTASPTATLHVSGTVKFTLGSDATGDVFYRNSSGTVSRLGVGTDGQVLTLTSGLPAWSAGGGGAGTWNGISNPTGNQSLTHGTYTTTWAFTQTATSGFPQALSSSLDIAPISNSSGAHIHANFTMYVNATSNSVASASNLYAPVLVLGSGAKTDITALSALVTNQGAGTVTSGTCSRIAWTQQDGTATSITLYDADFTQSQNAGVGSPATTALYGYRFTGGTISYGTVSSSTAFYAGSSGASTKYAYIAVSGAGNSGFGMSAPTATVHITGTEKIEHSSTTIAEYGLEVNSTLTGANTSASFYYANAILFSDQSTAGIFLPDRANLLVRYTRPSSTTDYGTSVNVISEMLMTAASGTLSTIFVHYKSKFTITAGGTLGTGIGFLAAYPTTFAEDVSALYGFIAESGMNNGFGTSGPQATVHISGTFRVDLGSDATGDMHYRAATTGLQTRISTSGKSVGNVLALYDSGGGVLLPNWAVVSGSSGYATIQDEGTPVTAQTTLNFTGAGVTATNDAVNSRTNIIISAVVSSAIGSEIVYTTGTGTQSGVSGSSVSSGNVTWAGYQTQTFNNVNTSGTYSYYDQNITINPASNSTAVHRFSDIGVTFSTAVNTSSLTLRYADITHGQTGTVSSFYIDNITYANTAGTTTTVNGRTFTYNCNAGTTSVVFASYASLSTGGGTITSGIGYYALADRTSGTFTTYTGFKLFTSGTIGTIYGLVVPLGSLNGIGVATPLYALDVANTTATATGLQIIRSYDYQCTSTPADAWGLSTVYKLQSTTTASRLAAQFDVYWQESTDASRTAIAAVKTAHKAQTVAYQRQILGCYKDLTDDTAVDIFSVAFGTTDHKGVCGRVTMTVFAKQTVGSNQIQVAHQVVAFNCAHNAATNTGFGLWGGPYGVLQTVSTGSAMTFTFYCNTVAFSTPATSANTYTFSMKVNSDLTTFAEFYTIFNVELNGDADITLTP